MAYWADPSQIGFPPLGPEDLIRLGEDLLHVHPIYYEPSKKDENRISSISDVISRGIASPTGLSSADATVLTETFRNAIPVWHHAGIFSDPWTRLSIHALLRGSRIFPGLELCDKPPDYTPLGFTDIWKGEYHGEPVCVKVVRAQRLIELRKVEGTYRRVIEESKLDSHPNVLPVIRVSERLFPFCIMCPWMPDGNITQYTEMNPGADHLILLAQVCWGLTHLHELGILHGSISPNNIMITQDGQASLGDFAIAGNRSWNYKPETLQYMAPERFSGEGNTVWVQGPSKESDIYSVAMTSFSVLTGVLPYHGSNAKDSITDIRAGKRPSRPIDSSQSRLLQDPVWNVITTGWRDEPRRRCKLSVMYRVFSPPTQQRQLGKTLPRVASFFWFPQNSGSEIQSQVDEMNQRLENDELSDRDRFKLLNKLCKTCSRHCVIPTPMLIPDCSEDSVEVESGGFADVSRGTHKGRRVAIKVVRVYVTSDLDAIRSRFCREGVAWKHLRHPNILPLIGVSLNEHRFALVSDWMEHGNINDFIGEDRHINRTELLVDVANGLKYMHDLRIVHGDLKGANILVNKERRACIADFGLSTITGVATRAAAGFSQASLISNDTLMSFTGGGTRRWMSPELLDPERFGMPESEGDRPTRQSDCYALGMVIYEVLCGHHPYLEFPSDILAVNAIVEGVRPKKPEGAKLLGFTDELWRIVGLCWLEDRNARPGVGVIHSCLTGAAAFWNMREAHQQASDPLLDFLHASPELFTFL